MVQPHETLDGGQERRVVQSVVRQRRAVPVHGREAQVEDQRDGRVEDGAREDLQEEVER